ncbi:MAG: YraN family protein [Oligoflexales bacterium]|nr:YraN family protein [Oligoflexales bacterium]
MLQLSACSTSSNKYRTAALAEDLVASLLEKKSWKVLRRNFRKRACEIDILASKSKLLLAVEVKWRKNFKLEMADVEQLMPYKKRQALKKGMQHFVQLSSKRGHFFSTLRCDLIVLYLNTQKQIDYFYSQNIEL